MQLQLLASCLTCTELRLVIVKHLRPFLLDLMMRLTDPRLVLYEQHEQLKYRECLDSLKRSELIAATLAELQMYLPPTSTVVQQYFETAPCFFAFVEIVATQEMQSNEALMRLRRIAKTTFLLLRARPMEFSSLYNWTPFFSLSFHDDMHVRWYAARATAQILKMGNIETNTFLSGLCIDEKAAESGSSPVARQIELELHVEDTARQEHLIEVSTYQQQDESEKTEFKAVPLHDSLTNVFGVIVPTSKLHQQRSVSTKTSGTAAPLVPTSSTKRNLRSLAIALSMKRPILVAGPSGCGKTATIRELARLSGNDDMVELHLDDQIDSKTLLGSYVCTDIPGEFTWQPGALTTAVLTGRWVVIEDIDQASFEVLAALLPLLEMREMVLPGRGQLLVAHPNFQVFGTTTRRQQMPKGFQESIWTSVGIAPLAQNEIEHILLTCFAEIPQQIVSKIMGTYNAVSGNTNEELCDFVHPWEETRRNYGRDFCLRDLLKWCKRIYCFCCYAEGAINRDYITEDMRMRIVVEALDIFCAGIRDVKTRLRSACALASIWEVQPDKIKYYLEQHKPHVMLNAHELQIGRVHLATLSQQALLEQGSKPASCSVVMTGHVLRLLEKMGAIVATCEPALLIGETGCGKTTIIQHLAAVIGQRLVVQNLNIQSDSSDLVGGFKPVEIHLLARPLYMTFVDLFTATFSQKSNAKFLNVVRIALEHKDWKKLVKGMRKAIQMTFSKLRGSNGEAKRNALESTFCKKASVPGVSLSSLESQWDNFEAELGRFERQQEQAESHFAFSFVEGVLVKALREGHWVLLDEINLASPDTLERIGTLLEHETCAFSLTERGDVELIRPHPNFRLFGAMNPSTDIGKKDLPPSLRNRFTEIYVDECVDRSDLQMVVHHQFKEIAGALIPETVEFYLEAKKQADLRLSDGARHKPRYSLRTLSQALHISRILIQRGYGTSRAMYEGFCSSFCTQLETNSRQYLDRLIKNTFAKTLKSKELTRSPPCPGGAKKTSEYVLVSSYWVQKGEYQPPRDDSLPNPVTSRRNFVLTKSVEENLRHVSRASLIGKYPVLLQGPTSAGKTSLIQYLAARVGQKCVRINNHEHTDIQEYLGSYVSDSNGKLAFKEGVLVEAMRKGWWIILDELNLAPSEVLEALNRLLDDNRELFLPETQETIKPHPKFMLFATQNPPGLYGGRKVLSRAFRNRFLEIQVDEVASNELQTILQERSSLPPSYCRILIDIMQQLQLVRQQSSVFAGKSGFVTTRDLLRWAERRPATKQALAEEGYCLLAERLRRDDEKRIVQRVLEKICNVEIDLNALYCGKPRASNLLNENGEIEQETVWGTMEQFEQIQTILERAVEEAVSRKSSKNEEKLAGNAAGLDKISVTKSLRRLFALVGRCLQNEEPVLLVGETGCGKTTVCQLYSILFAQPLHILNCHQHTETSDFLGCLRPVRGKERTAQELEEALTDFAVISDESIDEQESKQRRGDARAMGLTALLSKYEHARASVLAGDSIQQKKLIEQIDTLKRRFQSIFEWVDGPLVESMKKGNLILIDEINLAEDAVLERLNSVLEPSRTLLLAEKGGDQVEEIVAHPTWRVMATMNPGGDFGKRELSPALRNRFTEIWVPALSDLDDIATIIRDRLVGYRSINHIRQSAAIDYLTPLCNPILSFVKYFNEENGSVGGCGTVTLRDVLSWINFITSLVKKQQDDPSLKVTAWTAFVQGAALSILDGLGLGSDKALQTALKAREKAYDYLLSLVPDDNHTVKTKVIESLNVATFSVQSNMEELTTLATDGVSSEEMFGLNPFLIPRGPNPVLRKSLFSLKAPTTMSNLYRVLRAMQVGRPIILEGSPGVGKTSLISALAAASGHRLVRINLSEQTDISDLFGSDLPATCGDNYGQEEPSNGSFEWCDGVFLRAMKAGDWVLLDELNLASQSVLEGLNSCLDHRGSVYIPELDHEFDCPPTFRLFAAQNPLREGGGRKGLPKSFLNRFTRVFIEFLNEQDLIHIASSRYPTLHRTVENTMPSDPSVAGKTLLERMISFNRAVHADTMVNCNYGRHGAPWEFNLRDVFRFCDLVTQETHPTPSSETQLQKLSYYANIIYVERMRSARDRELISRRFEEYFGVKPTNLDAVSLRVSPKTVEIGSALLERRQDVHVGRVALPILNFMLKPMEALVHCVNMSWPALLVGPSASGKTSSVRLLAALKGIKLHELGMSAGTDATELLGCFEQVDVERKLYDVKQNIHTVLVKALQKWMLASVAPNISCKARDANQKKVNRLCSSWWALTAREKSFRKSSVMQSHDRSELKKISREQVDEAIIDLTKDIVNQLKKNVAGDHETLSMLDGFVKDIDTIVQISKSASIRSCFEWVDGALVQAMEKGEWVLLDNVNFCSSSVLDRLNSLMETGGEMLINECGTIDGKLRVIRPHKNFRIFLAMDSQFGEISRAMRNRCVEIALGVDDTQRLDLIKIALSRGVPGFALSQAFQTVHERVMDELGWSSVYTKSSCINRRHLEKWSLLTCAELSRGLKPLDAITDSFQRVYGDEMVASLHLSQEIQKLLSSALQASQQSSQDQRALSSIAAHFTLPLCQQVENYVLQRNVTFLEHLILSAMLSMNGSDLQLSQLKRNSETSDYASALDKGCNLNAWLDCVVSQCKRQDSIYSQTVLEEACDHLSTKKFLRLEEATTPLAATLAPFALRRIMELTSTCGNINSDWSMTADHLLFTLEKIARDVRCDETTMRLVNLLVRFLQSKTKSTLYVVLCQQIDESVRQLNGLLDTLTCLPPTPLYLSANHAAFLRLQSLVTKRVDNFPPGKTEIDKIWRTILSALRYLQVLDSVDVLRFCELEQYRQVDELFAASSAKSKCKKYIDSGSNHDKLTLLQQSYAIHKFHADRFNVDNELTVLVYPLLNAVDAFFSEFISDSRLDLSFYEAVEAVLRNRFEFSIQLRVSAFDWTHFIIHWQWLKKALLQFAKLVKQHPAGSLMWSSNWNELLDMSERMQETIEQYIGCRFSKNVLWKKGGHSLLPNSLDLWKAESLLYQLSETFMHVNLKTVTAISEAVSTRPVDDKVDMLALLFGGVIFMEAAMKCGKLDVSPLFYVDVDSRKEVLQALCAISYLTQEQLRGKMETIDASKAKKPHALLAEELQKLPIVLLKKIQDQKSEMTELVSKKTLYLSVIKDTADSHVDFLSEQDSRLGKDVPILLFDMKETSMLIDRMVLFQLSPIFEHALARQELKSIAELMHAMNVYNLCNNDTSQTEYIESIKSIANVLKSLQGIIEESLRLGIRDPACLFVYQDILWCGHEFVNSENFCEARGDRADEIVRFVSVVQSHLNTILFNFHQFLRSSSFNNVDAISLGVFDTRKKLLKSNKRFPAVQTEVADHAEVISGFPRLFQGVQSVITLKNIAEVNLEASKCATSEVQMRIARLEKIRNHYEGEQVQSVETLVDTSAMFVRELFLATVLAFQSTFQNESMPAQWRMIQSLLLQFVKAPRTFDGETQAKLLKALQASEDERFVALIDVFVMPLLASLTTETQEQCHDHRIRVIGDSMVFLGLWRFALLLPSSPVDPATKPSVKKDKLLNRLALITLQDAANSSLHRLNPSPLPSKASVETDCRLLRELHGQVMKVSAHAIPRYKPVTPRCDAAAIDPNAFEVVPVTASVFGELFRDLLRFNTTVMPAEKMVALLAKTRSSKLSLQQKREVLRDVEMFQQTSESFIAQSSKKFGKSFRDVFQPVAAAIYCVKEGITLVAWSLHENVKNVSLKEQQKEALALSLVQFPSTLNVNVVDHPWHHIEALLQAVGKSASSILFGASGFNTHKVEVALLDVLLSKVELLFRETLSTSRTNRAAFETALRSSKTLFDLFLVKWQKQKDREEQKQKEAEELFKYKVRQLDLETEDELLEKEYREQFPDYSSRDFQAFLQPDQALRATDEVLCGMTAKDVDVLITDNMMQRLCETHVKLYAETANSKVVTTSLDIVDTFARAFTLAVKMRKPLNAMASTAIERAVASSGVLAASLVQSRLGSSIGSGKSHVPSFQALTSDYIQGIDFHRDPLVQEVVLVAEPLQRLMVKIQSLLAQWPDHAILQQIVLIADRIRNFEISSPLVRTLTGVELLLRKAQEWEMYAARACSISDELGPLSALVVRWRKLELYSWPHLLYVKEKQHRTAAQKTWINLYSLLTAQFETDVGMADDTVTNRSRKAPKLQWLHLNHLTSWLFDRLDAGRQALTDAARDSETKQREFMTKLFETLDAYIRLCPIGQYETRLVIVYSFCAQLFMELWNSSKRRESSIDLATVSSKYALANMLYHLYRYYGQYVNYLERQWRGLKAPIQRKLMEFVKICRWDEQTYYSLAESAEKSHRKLMKFVRDYDAVLTVSMQSIIDASTDSGISKDGGFVGIHSTTTELAGLDDEVVVDRLHEEQDLQKTVEGKAGETKQEEAKILAKEAPLGPERPFVLRLIHNSSRCVASSEAVSMMATSSYAGKLSKLSKRIAKYTQEHILSQKQVERRQQVHTLCENLCETIFYRMFKLQKAVGLPKGAKKKALIDLLGELKSQGMSYHRLQLPAELQQIQRLFELDVPDVENCIHIDQLDSAVDPEQSALNAGDLNRTRKAKREKSGRVQEVTSVDESLAKNSPSWLWQRADGYYYRFLSQLTSLRYSATTSFSHDLSSSEIERMSGYAENMFYTMLQQRQMLHAASLNHENLVTGLKRLKVMKEFKENYFASGGNNETVVNPRLASEWQSFQLTSIDALRPCLRELEISVLEILQQSPAVTEVRQQFQHIFERCDLIQESFAACGGMAKSLGVPAIPYHNMSACEVGSSGDTIVNFARPSNRVYGVSPIVLRNGSQIFQVAVDVLIANSARFSEIRSLVLNISSTFRTGTPMCLDEFLTQYTTIICNDAKFVKSIGERIDNGIVSRGDRKANDMESQQSNAKFLENYDKLVGTVLVSIQELTKFSKDSPSSTSGVESESGEVQALCEELATMHTMVKVSRVNVIASQLAELLEVLQSQYEQFLNTHSEEWKRAFVSSLTLLECIEPSLVDVRGISRQLLVDFLVAHKSVMKLDYVLVRIFRNLFQHGFCRTDEEKQDEEGDQSSDKTNFQDDVEGTGMGAGEGKKDVSDEIEDEEQLLGLQGDRQEEPELPSEQKAEDTGLEMQNDFEGTMHDMPDDEEGEQEESEEREELDREMGDFDQNDENVVDEKLWGEDSDDDEDRIDKEKEKFEENSQVKGEALEDEVRGQIGDDEKEDQSNAQDEDKQKPQLDQSDVKESKDDDEDGKEEMEDINDDFEDKYENHHDIDLTEHEDGRDEDAQEDHGDELPEDMQLDLDGEEGLENGDVEEDNPEEETIKDLEDEAVEANTSKEEIEDVEEENEDEQPDSAVQRGGGGLEDEQEKEENDIEQPDSFDRTEEEQNALTTAGIQSKDGQDELDIQDPANQDMEDTDIQEQEEEQSNDDNTGSRAQKLSSSDNQNAKEKWKPQSQLENSLNQELPHKKRSRHEPNPYRNAQEAQEHWKNRVEMIDRTKEDTDDNTLDKHEKPSTMTTSEYVDDDEEMEDVEHALAAADESQIMNQPRADADEIKDEDDEEAEFKSDVKASAMEIDEVEEEKSKELNDTHAQPKKQVKQPLKPDTDVVDENTIQEDKGEDQDMEHKSPTESGEYDLLDENMEQTLPSRVRDIDLPNTLSTQTEGDEGKAREVTLLSPNEVAALRDELDSFIVNWSMQSDQHRGADLWSKYTALTAGASQRLCEQLRLVLEPMLRSKLEGDFRTGKRINMRKVIPYIASQFRKDKIWMRRTRPSKRQYQVMLAIDDSESMADNNAGRLALEALATLCKGMTQLEVGELSIVKFGQDLELLHAFDMPFTDDAGSRIIGRFGFQQKKTNMVQTLDTILQLLETAKKSTAGGSSSVEYTQIVFLISDGRFDSDGRVRIRKLIETALERQQLIVLLVVDQGAAESQSNLQQTSILDTQSVTFEKGKVRMVPYLLDYPFPYYVLLPSSAMLPEILSDSLRQWFEMLQSDS
ncbi:hypothetical protein PsorP6_009691 [Peronosclerospora sorghi]|uniref:Uncharacterized protein n=1 Tax=Peronosclerospora sorghi TaxID=230839 RepID=A0ACC0W181_9STRA|nr:hypothetical protein PsorP6_009691 [Peronosclerospora sorghi]